MKLTSHTPFLPQLLCPTIQAHITLAYVGFAKSIDCMISIKCGIACNAIKAKKFHTISMGTICMDFFVAIHIHTYCVIFKLLGYVDNYLVIAN